MLSVYELPYLTSDVPGTGGVIKTVPEDFAVEEVPLYEPGGEGTHVYFRIEKRGVPTMQAVNEIARALGRASRDIGYAGLKDADAVTSQMMSLEHVDPAQIEALNVPRIRVLSVSRHTNKLKLGHLRGNRFVIRLRQGDVGRADDVRLMLESLAKRGVPNYFGPQRFGMRGDTWEIGRALLRQDYEEAVAVMLGRPSERDHGEVLEARQRFEAGQFEAAAETWPYLFHNERRVCRQLARRPDPRRALKALDRNLWRFYFSAYQSQLFNQVVARRLDRLDRLIDGDLAWRHPQGAVFKVEDAAEQQPRCDTFEISPTGPLFGHRMSEPEGEPQAMEQAVLDAEELTLDAWREPGKHKMRGGRRPLRFQPHEAAVEAGSDEIGEFLELRFFLESGCYATTVLREICKQPVTGAETES